MRSVPSFDIFYSLIDSASDLSSELKSTIDKVVQSQKVVLFMKGTKEFPQCGFSDTVVQVLNSLNVPFETLNILENEVLRQGMKEYSNWPTFPQLYIDGEFFGGCEIVVGEIPIHKLENLSIRTPYLDLIINTLKTKPQGLVNHTNS